MPILNITLRLIHIFTGVAWLGGTLLMFGFVNPTAKELGKDAAAFMQHLTQQTKYVPFFGTVAILSPVTGVWLYLRQFNGAINTTSNAGANLTIGGIFGLLAMINGFTNIKMNGDKLGALSKSIGMSGAPPTPEQMEKIQGFQDGINKGLAYGTVLLTLALIFMSFSEIPQY